MNNRQNYKNSVTFMLSLWKQLGIDSQTEMKSMHKIALIPLKVSKI